MSDRQLSLTDVQNGMFKQSVQMKLGGSLFQFLWGLIMTANNLKPRFKNPFDLTVGQAIGIGGGNSRQAVWTKQQKLKKIRIEGQWLVKIKNGNKQKNIPATYEINYNLIVPPNLVVPEFDAHQSKIIDGSVDASATDPLTDPLTILRSEERREEQIPPTPQNNVTTGEEPKKVELDEVDGLVSFASKKWRLPNPAPLTTVRRLYNEYGLELLQEAMETTPPVLDNMKWSSILGYVAKTATGLLAHSRGAATPQKLDNLESELRKLEDELKIARQEENSNPDWIRQQEERAERLRDAINIVSL